MRFFLSVVAIFALACSATENKKTPTFADIIARAEALRAQGSTEKALYLAISDDLVALRAANPEYAAAAANRKLANDYRMLFGPVTCTLQIEEPTEPLFIDTGFAAPIVIRSECPARAPFTFDTDSRALTLAPAGFNYANGTMQAKIKVNSATADASQNRMAFAAHYYAAEFLMLLEKDFGASQSAITLAPSEYLLKAIPQKAKIEQAVVKAASVPQVLAQIEFTRGSIQISREARRQLVALEIGRGTAIRIQGFADAKAPHAKQLATMRARAVASFLKETKGEFTAHVEWTDKAHPDGFGVVIEGE